MVKNYNEWLVAVEDEYFMLAKAERWLSKEGEGRKKAFAILAFIGQLCHNARDCYDEFRLCTDDERETVSEYATSALHRLVKIKEEEIRNKEN